ncbi:MAG: hypothetical protein A2X49_05930 [Lentisphaerae bacterium GWF2_52_8]|nr:MAG: hypothetical protein A2X49_05930 [Lentisphaerae bacterium GWF2_52_8]
MPKIQRKNLSTASLKSLLQVMSESKSAPNNEDLSRCLEMAEGLEARLAELSATLKETELQGRQISSALQILPAAIFRHDFDGVISFSSKSVKNLFGQLPEDLLGENLGEIIHPYDRGILAEALDELRKKKKSFFSMRFLKKKKGESIHIDGLSVISNEKDEGEIITLCRPCSTRGSCPSRDAAQESEQILAAFIENTDQIVYMLSTDGIFEYVSPGWTKLLGHDPSEVEGSHFEPFIHKEDIDACKAYLKEVLKSKYPDWKPIYRVLCKDGGYRWHNSNISLVRDSKGNPNGYIGISVDITDKVEAVERLKKSETQYKHLFNNIIDAAFIYPVAPDGTPGIFTQVNRVACLRFGCKEEEMLKLSLSKITDPTLGHLHLREAMRKMLVEGSVRFESIHVNKEGRKIPVDIIATRFENNGSVFCLSLAHDISGRKRTEIELSVAHSAVEKAMRIKSEFLANMSHEIRTPMNGIIGLSKLLSETPLSELQKEYVSTIMLSADTLMDVVNDILDITKLEFGKVKIEEEPFTLLEPVKEVLKMVRHNAKAKGLQLSLDAPGLDKTVVLGDAVRIRQIMLSLVSNAVKFTEKGGVKISVRLAMRERQKGIAYFEVEDSGIGISSDKFGDIFEKFFQEDSSSTRKFGGLGLGLSIAKQLIELMGGEIKVESKKGVGSKFYFTLPLCLATTPSPNKQEKAP